MSSVTEHASTGTGDHLVQFYEHDEELVARAGAYLGEAAREGAVAIVIATEAHRRAFEARLREAGVDVAAACDEGTLVVLDAAETLARFMGDAHPDRDAFFDVVGTVVHAAAATGRPVCAFGEMVALLWEAGDVMAAIELETLWNELANEVSFSLYCAYRSESVAGHEHADALDRVCRLHSAVVPEPPVEATWQFAADSAAPQRARQLVAGALQAAGHRGDLLVAAGIVITELATNALLHARSPFSVSIRSVESGVRILVRDASRAEPVIRAVSSAVPSGRGMRLVAALASRWGVERVADGKVIWVELRR